MSPNTKTFPTAPLKDLDPAMLIFQLSHYCDKIEESNQAGADSIRSAMEIASYLHKDQTRRVRADFPVTPYIEHPLRVALRLARWGVTDPEIITAALLHDVLEDCADKIETSFDTDNATQWIKDNYGDNIALWVTEVTNNSSQPYQDKIESLAFLGSSEALLIKASDLIDNAGSLHYQLDNTEKSWKQTVRLANKYAPAMLLVKTALQEHYQFNPISVFANNDLDEKPLINLEAISARITAEFLS